jgi:hypothetical protein
MTNILLKKCTRDEIEVLREQIHAFLQQQAEKPIGKSKGNIDFYVNCILVDVLKRLSIKLRNKVELSCKYQVTIRISQFEASALLLVCHWELRFLNAYQKNVLMKTRNNIDQQLTNFN